MIVCRPTRLPFIVAIACDAEFVRVVSHANRTLFWSFEADEAIALALSVLLLHHSCTNDVTDLANMSAHGEPPFSRTG